MRLRQALSPWRVFPVRAVGTGALAGVAFAGWFQVSGFAQGEDPVSATVAGLQRRYAAITTVTASFVQTYQAPGISQTESGTLWMKKPGFMFWEYRTPETKFFYADGRRTYLYVPEDRQVMVRSFREEDLRSTPLEFLLGKGEIPQSFRVLAESEIRPVHENAVLVRLIPRAADLDYSFLTLEIDRQTFELRRLVIRERTGNTSEFAFSDMRMNVKISDSRFRFQIPKGVDVVELDEK